MTPKPTKLATLPPGSTMIKPDLGSVRLEVKPCSTPTSRIHVRTKSGPRPSEQTLQSTWVHQAWLASACTTVFIALAKSIAGSIDAHIWVKPILAILAGYIGADLFSGVFHWGIDNYGGATTPIFGTLIVAFQRHHEKPWIITRNQLANLLLAPSQTITITLLPINLIYKDATLMAFVGSFSGCLLFSLKFHAWSHSTKKKLPLLVVALQDIGVLMSPSHHAKHHHVPYNSNYCMVSGIWNKFLDENKVFVALEVMLHLLFRVPPRSWDEPSFEWTDESSAPLPKINHEVSF